MNQRGDLPTVGGESCTSVQATGSHGDRFNLDLTYFVAHSDETAYFHVGREEHWKFCTAMARIFDHTGMSNGDDKFLPSCARPLSLWLVSNFEGEGLGYSTA